MAVRNRALSLATRGVLAGSALALATHGLLQVPEPPVIELPVVQAPTASGGAALHYLAVPRHWNYISEATLILDADSLARLEERQPVVIEDVKPTGFYAVYNSRGELHILSETESTLWDQGEDDDEVVSLVQRKCTSMLAGQLSG